MSANTRKIFYETYSVRSFEINPKGLVKLSTLCNFLQDAARKHAYMFDYDIGQLRKQNKTWILYRLQLKMQEYPSWHDSVTVETWPSGGEGIIAYREFLMYNQHGDILGKGTGQWMILNLENKRPIRIPREVLDMEVTNRSHMITPKREKLSALSNNGSITDAPFQVRRSDLDINGHVNNVIYIKWIAESVSANIYQDHQISELDIIYKAESKLGDQVRARSKPADLDNTSFNHDIIRKSDDTTLSTAQTTWKQFNNKYSKQLFSDT